MLEKGALPRRERYKGNVREKGILKRREREKGAREGSAREKECM